MLRVFNEKKKLLRAEKIEKQKIKNAQWKLLQIFKYIANADENESMYTIRLKNKKYDNDFYDDMNAGKRKKEENHHQSPQSNYREN